MARHRRLPNRRLRRSRARSCYIYYAPTELLQRYAVSMEHLRRHERGHCNGWRHEPPQPIKPKQPILTVEEIERMFDLKAGQSMKLLFPR